MVLLVHCIRRAFFLCLPLHCLKDKYNSYTTAQADAVATLMRYVGQLEKMMYGVTGSGIYTTNSQIIATMFKTLGYDSNTRLANKSSYSATNWEALIQNEMAETAG